MPKILLVEDDPMISEIYERKLSASGFEVRKTTTGKGALSLLRSEPIDLVLLDIVLQEIGGLEILEEFRNPKNGYNQNIRVVIFSNLNEPEDRDRAEKLGVDGFISKTEFSPSKLVEEVRRIIGQSSMREDAKNLSQRAV